MAWQSSVISPARPVFCLALLIAGRGLRAQGPTKMPMTDVKVLGGGVVSIKPNHSDDGLVGRHIDDENFGTLNAASLSTR
jgi:hypothetical protein